MDGRTADKHLGDPRWREALRVALAYALFGLLWFLASDWLLDQAVRDPAWRFLAAAAKGLVFIAVTVLWVCLIWRRRLLPAKTGPQAMANPAAARPAPHSLTPLWLLTAAIAVFAALALRHVYNERVAHHGTQLQAVADLRAKQVEGWIKDRLSNAGFVRSSALWAGLYRRWHEGGDVAARDQLLERGAELAKAFGYSGFLVLDERGEGIAGGTGSDWPTPPALRAAALSAMASGESRHTGLYNTAGDPGHERLDLVVPLMGAGQPARAAVVLRLDPDGSLLAPLRAWPVPSRTAVTLLVRREGDQLVGAFGRNPRPLSSPNLHAARAIRGDVPFGQAAQGIDVHGNPVLGVVRPVQGMDWFLVAKIDRAEINAEAMQDATWIVASAAFALLGSVLATWLLRERRAAQMARADQLRDMQLAEQLRRLGTQMDATEDRERRQLARDLHDDLGQLLAAARIRLAILCNDEREDVRLLATKVDALIDSANLSTRSLAAQLSPEVLYELGLCPALEWLAEQIEHAFGLAVKVVDDGEPKPLSQATRSILFRAARELLINVAKHARTGSAVVETQRQGGSVVVRVSDAGCGFDPAARVPATGRAGLGLVSVRERLSFIGGTVDVRSAPNEGTVAVLSAPLPMLEPVAIEVKS